MEEEIMECFYVLKNGSGEILDRVRFDFDPVNFSFPIQQAGYLLVPKEEREAYDLGELDAYQSDEGEWRYIEEV